MKDNAEKIPKGKHGGSLKTFFQEMYITLQLFGQSGLTNHAAACAYGFLLSMAPMLIVLAFIVILLFNASPEDIFTFIGHIPILGLIFDEQWLSSELFNFTAFGISGLISLLSIFWAGRIFALSMQRGLNIIFYSEKSRNPVKSNLIIVAVEISMIILILLILVSSQTAMYLYKNLDFIPENSIIEMLSIRLGGQITTSVIFGFAAFLIFIFMPVKSPRKISAFYSALLCSIAFFCLAYIFSYFQNQARFLFLYGALGNIVLLLVNVYFFFNVFFICAQFAFVLDFFDGLLFLELKRNIDNEKNKKKNYITCFLFPLKGSLDKYKRQFNKDEIIMHQGESTKDIFFLLEGEVEILLPTQENEFKSAALLSAGSFFGEMSYLLSEDRTATARAKTSVSVFALPPSLFEFILKYDTAGIDRNIIEHMSQRLKKSNIQYIDLQSSIASSKSSTEG